MGVGWRWGREGGVVVVWVRRRVKGVGVGWGWGGGVGEKEN